MKDLDQPPINHDNLTGFKTIPDAQTPWYKIWWIYPVALIIVLLIVGGVFQHMRDSDDITVQSAHITETEVGREGHGPYWGDPEESGAIDLGQISTTGATLGETVTVEGISLTIEELSEIIYSPQTKPGSDQPEENTYQMRVKLTNHSDEPVSVSGQDFVLVGYENMGYLMDVDASEELGDKELVPTTLEPGETIEGTLVFNTPYLVRVAAVGWKPTGDSEQVFINAKGIGTIER